MSTRYVRLRRPTTGWVFLFINLLIGAGALPGWAQAPAWQQALAVSTSASSSSSINAVVPDASGNAYVVGNFTGTITLAGTTLSSTGTYSGFVAKWNSSTSAFVWAKPLLSSEHIEASSLAVVGSSVYVSGSYQGTAQVGNATFSNFTTSQVFVAKLLDAGSTSSFSWVQATTGPDYKVALSLAAQGSNIYLGGQLNSPPASFGPLAATSAGAFVAKLTDAGASGSFTWVQVASTTTTAFVRCLAVQGSTVYAGGTFLGSLTAGATTLTGPASVPFRGFVAKLTDAGSTGSFTWVQGAGGNGTGGVFVVGIAATSAGVYVAGNFTGAGMTFGSTTLNEQGNGDIFVAKLTDAGSTGSFTWAQPAGGPDDETALTLAAQGTNIYLGGDFSGPAARFGSTVLATTAGYAAFAAKLTDAGPTGSFAWALGSGGSGAAGITTLFPLGAKLYAGGQFQNGATFGTQPITTSATQGTGLLAIITDQGALATATPAAGAPAVVFPNPAHGHTTVARPAGLGAGPATLTLLDALGRVVRTAPPTLAPTAELDLAGVAPGVYVLRVAVGTATTVGRLAVE